MASRQQEHCQGSLDKLHGALVSAQASPTPETLQNVVLIVKSLGFDYYTITVLDEKIDTTVRQRVLEAIEQVASVVSADPVLHALVLKQRMYVIRQAAEIMGLGRGTGAYDEDFDGDA